MSQENLVAFCYDCLSTIPDYLALKDPFLKEGKTGVCPFCKGPMNAVPESVTEKIKKQRRSGTIII